MTQAPAPLAGRRIVVTRARAQASDLVQRLTALGADVVAAPVIQIKPMTDLAPLRRALAALSTYDWVVFTSSNAVEIACTEPAAFAGIKVAAIGPATAAALAHLGVSVDLVPEPHVAEALVTALAARDLAGKRVLVPCAERARPVLGDGLRASGAVVDVIPVYRTVADEGDGADLAAELQSGNIAAVTFTSSSTVEHFVSFVGGAAATAGWVAITVVTTAASAAAARQLRRCVNDFVISA